MVGKPEDGAQDSGPVDGRTYETKRNVLKGPEGNFRVPGWPSAIMAGLPFIICFHRLVQNNYLKLLAGSRTRPQTCTFINKRD
jgi:hypothetical protein